MLTTEQQIAQLISQNKGLAAQCEAAKQMVNEGLQVSLQLRTNLHIFQQANQEQATQIKTLQAELAALKQPVEPPVTIPDQLPPAA